MDCTDRNTVHGVTAYIQRRKRNTNNELEI